jgi:glucokinase
VRLKIPPAWDLDRGVVVGVDIGGTQCSVSIGAYGDGHFELIDRNQFATRSHRGPDQILAEIENAVRAALSGQPDAKVVGISCGGPMDAASGIIQSPPNLPGWDNVPITERLRQALGLRCVLENDANASAVAEWAFGVGRGVGNLVYLTFGTGLGAGMILDGGLYRGVGDLAGEVGHWRIGPELGPVHYGKQGSFEGYCSGGGIVEWYEYFGGTAGADAALSAEVIARRARAGEEPATRVFDQAARQLGRGIALLVDALAPELVIVGGIYGYATDLLQPGMLSAFAEEAHPRLAEGTKIVPAQLGREVGSYASCSVALLDAAAAVAAAALQADGDTDAAAV